MKKILLLALAVMFVGSISAQSVEKDQTAPANGSKVITHIQGNFTGEDFLTGETIDFNAILEQGKAIIVDVFGFWCGPCWSFHQTHALEGLTAYDDVVPVMVECQWYTGSFTQADRLAGITGNQGNSQGDWTNGGTNPVAILAGQSISASAFDAYSGQNTDGVPALYMICPNGDVMTIARSTTAAGLHANIANSCMDEDDVPVVSIVGPTSTATNSNVNFSANVRSVVPITSYAWTFTGGTPASATTENASTSYATAGSYTVSLTVSNANGSATATHTINIIDCSNGISTFPYQEGFEATTLPSCWFTLDKDGDGYCWATYNEVTASISGVPAGSQFAHSGNNAMTAWSYYPTAYSSTGWSGNALASDEYLITPAISLPAGSNYKVSYWVRNLNTDYPDNYALKLSTTGMNEADFTTTIAATSAPGSSYTQKVHDLSAYAGQTIYLAFHHTGNDDFGMFLDDFYIGDNPTAINESAISTISIYPNPAKNQLFIQSEQALQQVEIYTMQGALVKAIHSNQQEINISDLSAGIYMVKAYTNEGVSIQKFIKE